MTNNLKRKMKVALIPAILVIVASLMFIGVNLGLGLVGAGSYNSPNTLVPASVTITSICYIGVVPATVAFGNVYAGGNTLTNFVVTDTDTGGDSPANILLAGNTLWTTTTAGAYNSFYIQNTLWDPTNDLSFTGNHLTNALVDSHIQVPAPTQATPSTTANVYFGLGIPGGTLASDLGTPYTTTIIVEDSC